MSNESIRIHFKVSFESWLFDRKTAITGQENQLDRGSASNIISNKFLIAAQRTKTREGPANKAKEAAIFCKIDQIFYPREAVDVEFSKNDYLNQYRDIKLFKRVCQGAPIKCVYRLS